MVRKRQSLHSVKHRNSEQEVVIAVWVTRDRETEGPKIPRADLLELLLGYEVGKILHSDGHLDFAERVHVLEKGFRADPRAWQ